MKKMITAITPLLIGGLIGYSLNKKPECIASHQDPLTRTEKLDRTNWDVVDTDGDGTFDQLITPHRNSYYGTKGPVYTRGGRDFAGEVALGFSKAVITYKNEFSKMISNDETVYWLCRVDDFNEDGLADRISWPRMGDRMPIFERSSFPERIKEKADDVVIYENYILDYLTKKYYGL